MYDKALKIFVLVTLDFTTGRGMIKYLPVFFTDLQFSESVLQEGRPGTKFCPVLYCNGRSVPPAPVLLEASGNSSYRYRYILHVYNRPSSLKSSMAGRVIILL